MFWILRPTGEASGYVGDGGKTKLVWEDSGPVKAAPPSLRTAESTCCSHTVPHFQFLVIYSQADREGSVSQDAFESVDSLSWVSINVG